MPNTALNRTVVVYATNKSGVSRAYGDVVVIDTANPSAFTTTIVTGYTATQQAVIIEPNGLVNNASGLIALSGWVPRVNLSSVANVSQFFKTHSVAGQAIPHSGVIQAGDFGYALTSSATPEAILFGVMTQSSIAVNAGWAVSNVTVDKTYNANATSINELADILGTLINTLISQGVLSA